MNTSAIYTLQAQERWAMLAYTAAMVLLGTLGIFVNEAGLDSVTIVFFRCLFGAAALAAYCWWKGLFVRANLDKQDLLLAVASGVLMVINWVAFFEAIQRVGISVATVVFHVQPFLVLLIGALVFGERVSAGQTAWIAVGFAGLVLATGLGADLAAGGIAPDAGYVVGLACTLLAALLYAGVTVMTKAVRRLRPHLTALIHCAIGVLMLSFWVPAPVAGIGAGQWGWLASLGLIHTAFVYVLVYGALPRLKNASIAVLTFVYPGAAVAFDFLVYGHVLSISQLAGVALILLAGAGVNLEWGWKGVSGLAARWLGNG